jgi:hypothetical protein
MTIPLRCPEPCNCRECDVGINKGDLVIGYRDFYDNQWHKSFLCLDCENYNQRE